MWMQYTYYHQHHSHNNNTKGLKPIVPVIQTTKNFQMKEKIFDFVNQTPPTAEYRPHLVCPIHDTLQPSVFYQNDAAGRTTFP